MEYTTRWLTWQVLSLKLGLSTNNNLLVLAQLSGRAFYYLELKYGQEYATMELTKNKQIRADSTVAFRVAHQPKHWLFAAAIDLPHLEKWPYTLQRPSLCSTSLSVLKLATVTGRFPLHWPIWRLPPPPVNLEPRNNFEDFGKREVWGRCHFRKDTSSRRRLGKVIRCRKSSPHEESLFSYHFS